MKKIICFILFLFLFTASHNIVKAQQRADIQRTTVFQAGENGYSCFRIPAVIQTKTGILLAFAEARKNSCADSGDIDMVEKRSEDGGRTWSPLIIVRDDGENACDNPIPIVDRRTGRIILVTSWGAGNESEAIINSKNFQKGRRIFVSYSDDEGLTWSAAKDITTDVKQDGWAWNVTGPCHGIQLQKGPHKNRYVVPANHTFIGAKGTYTHVIYSDDGLNWKLGGIITEQGGNESTVVELKNGTLMLNMRNYNRKISKTRSFVTSKDCGLTWSKMQYAPELIEPVCQGSILNLTKNGKLTSRILFSNPASEKERVKMTIRMSKDNAKTWPYSFLVNDGPSAYSDIVVMDNTTVGILYENGVKDAYEKIEFAVVPVSLIK
jgi:sialidase-1